MKQRTIRLAATGARVATGAVLAAACVLGVVSAVAAPWPTLEKQPASATINPAPGETTLVCNGSFRALGRESTQASLMLSAGVPQLRVEDAGGDANAVPLTMPDVTGGTGAQVITATPADAETPPIAASESLRLQDADLTGLAAAPCREPSLRSWLVGGDMSTGASDVILLANPGDVTATVDLDVHGTDRARSTVVVPARTQLGVPLASVAKGMHQPVIEVTSSGAPVRAALQSALIRTLVPAGIDLQDGLSGPQSDLLLLGVRAAPAAAGDDAASGIVLRVLSRYDDATATVRVLSGTSVVDEYPVELAAGTPAEIALSGIPAGAYDIQIAASAPVVAAARQTLRSGGQEDFAWMLPAPQLSGTLLFSVPGGAPATLHLRNAGAEPVSVTLDGPSSRTVELGPGGSAEVPVDAGAHTLKSASPVHAAVEMLAATDDSALIAGWPLWAPAATQQPIIVR